MKKKKRIYKILALLTGVLGTILLFSVWYIQHNGDVVHQEFETSQYFQSIDTSTFQKRYSSGAYEVIDVRTPLEYKQGTIIPDPILINYYDSDFKNKLAKLNKRQPYLIYCRSGGRSAKTLLLMRELGFVEVHELRGGIGEWKDKNLPVYK